MINSKKVERIVKGFSNHRRIEIMELLNEKPELSVGEISDILKINFRTASEHIGKMARGGILMKRYDLNNVRLKLTPQGKSILAFCRKLE